MADINKLKDKIKSTIYPNGKGAINASDHQAMLLDMADGMAETDTKLATLSEETETIRTEVESQSELIEDLQNTKIDKEADDYYPQLSVGVADNLAGHEDATPSEIGFRRSGGGAILDGNARIEAIKGNSVVWNQLINATYLEANDATITKTDTGYTIVPTGGAPGLRTHAPNGNIKPIVGHKYAIICEKVGGSRGIFLNWGGFNTSLDSPIFTATDATKTQLTIYSHKETETFTITTPPLIDLTKMFGAGNEPTTIEEFYARIPSGIDEYAYNEGEVIHNATDKIESVGVNQWDEEWEPGRFTTTNGSNIDDAVNTMRMKNAIKVIPNTTYYCKAHVDTWVLFFDEEGEVIEGYSTGLEKYQNACKVNNTSFVTPTNAVYARAYFNQYLDNTATYNHDICINLSDPSVNGKYFPYVKREQSLDIIGKYFPNGMKSAGNAHDEIRYNKTTQKWEKVQRIGSVDMGIQKWEQDTADTTRFRFTATTLNIAYGTNILCAKYPSANTTALGDMKDKTIAVTNIADFPIVRIKDSAYTDAASFKTAMAGVILYYELANPIVTEIEEAFNLDYEVWNVGTEKASANVPSTPLKADIIYGFNAYGVIKELLARVASLEAANASLASQLASVTSHNEEV